MRSVLDLRVRADGKINTSPVTQVPQFIKMRKGFLYKFKIPTYDVDGDFVRCRFASSLLNECGGVCSPPAAAYINQNTCEFTFDAATATVGYYAMALVLEDFITSTSTTALSAVPVQLLIQVVNVVSSCVTG